MWESFKAFNINAVNNFLYLLTSNYWFILLVVGVIGIIILSLKHEVDKSYDDSQAVL